METYLVGGAVRDALLGRAVKERDWVVVGATATEMEAAGFRRVGKDFPVFLHPETGEEYALARTERKTGAGYHGFDVYAGADVPLEDDLQRRDLTVNAIAQTTTGELIDPWGGQADIAARRLRHVSAAFREDPLRVLRTARFAASLATYGFTIAADTRELMAAMVSDGELRALVPERVWKEIAKALCTERPDLFVAALRDCGALAQVLPEVDQLFGVPQPAQWHPEIDTGEHVLLTLRAAAKLTASLPVRFAALVHDLGKGATPPAEWPAHRGHEQRGLALIRTLCQRLAVPNDCRDMALQVAQFHTHVHRAAELRPATLLKVLEAVDAFRRPERFEEFLLGCEADARGRAGLDDRPYPQAALFRSACAAAKAVTTEPLVEAGLQGPAFGDALRKARVSAIRRAVAG
ncbi:MAG: multifunctional CCA addition/repair protein [Gammaproteobacteria bacterium]|jgi:tRNA nucleotidyltransferase (CCA-adding enzyme)|nr:multifunctional CCA addition/repair protein [Gammaproteobacteria bacterium]